MAKMSVSAYLKSSIDKQVVNSLQTNDQQNCSLPVAHSMASSENYNVRNGKSTGVEQGSAEESSTKNHNVRDS